MRIHLIALFSLPMFVFLCPRVQDRILGADGKETPQATLPMFSGSVKFSMSRSGKYIATLAENGTITVWDTAKKNQLAVCKVATGLTTKDFKINYRRLPACGLCFDSQHEGLLYFCNETGVHSWEWKERRKPRTLAKFRKLGLHLGFDPLISHMVCSPDGRMLSLIDGSGSLAIVGFATRKKGPKVPTVKTFRTFSSRKFLPTGTNHSVFFLPSSAKVLCTLGATIHSLDLKAQHPVKMFVGMVDNSRQIQEFVVSSRGKRAATIDNAGELLLWDLKTRSNVVLCKNHDQEGDVLAISQDEKLVAVGDWKRKVISIYSIQTGKKLTSSPLPKSGLTGLGFLPDNRTVFGIGEFPDVRYWQLDAKFRLRVHWVSPRNVYGPSGKK